MKELLDADLTGCWSVSSGRPLLVGGSVALATMMLVHASLAEGSSGVRWFSDVSGEVTFRAFTHESTELQEARYRGEGLVGAEFNIVKSSAVALLIDYRQATATGDSAIEGVAISPMEINYAWSLFAEHTGSDLLYRFGWQHACDHVIHKGQDPWYENYSEEDMPRDVFYHRLFLAAGTHTTRPVVQARRVFDNAPKGPLEKIVWYAEGAFQVRTLGSVDRQILYAGNDWQWQFLVDLRYPLFFGSSVAVFANSRTTLLLDVDYDTCWRELVQLEAFFRPDKFAASLSLGWHPIDEHPRDSHKGMSELAIRLLF